MIQKFEFKGLDMKGAYEITPFYATDERGGFIKDYNIDAFKQSQGFDLTGENQKALYIPQYFGHGYLVLEDSVVSYKCGEVFYGEGDAGIMYNDPDMAIEWPFDKIGGIEKLIISDKDKNLMSLKEYIEKVQ